MREDGAGRRNHIFEQKLTPRLAAQQRQGLILRQRELNQEPVRFGILPLEGAGEEPDGRVPLPLIHVGLAR